MVGNGMGNGGTQELNCGKALKERVKTAAQRGSLNGLKGGVCLVLGCRKLKLGESWKIVKRT